MQYLRDVHAPEIPEQGLVGSAEFVGKLAPHLDDASGFLSLVLKHQGGGLDESLNSEYEALVNSTRLE